MSLIKSQCDIRIFVGYTMLDGERCAVFTMANSDIAYLDPANGLKPCGKVRLLQNVEIDEPNAVVVVANAVVVRMNPLAGKAKSAMQLLVEDGCSMQKHLSPEQRGEQQHQYQLGLGTNNLD